MARAPDPRIKEAKAMYLKGHCGQLKYFRKISEFLQP